MSVEHVANLKAATAYAIGVHAVILLPVIVLGLYFLWSIGLSLGEVVSVSPDEKPVPSTALTAKGGQE